MNRIEYASRLFTDSMDGSQEIKSASVHKVCALLSDSLEIDTFQADLVSEMSLVPFERNSPLVWYRDDEPVGTFYVQSIKRTEANVYHIEATSNIGVLEQSEHYGGIYNGATVAEVAKDICNVPYAVKTNLQNISLYGWLPIATRRDNLAQVLFAIGATANTDYNGVLCISGLWTEASSDISDNRVFLGDSIDYASEITGVSVTEHQYVTGGETTTLFEGTAVAGDLVTFSEPMYNLTATGFRVTSSGANYAILSAGTGTLTGTKYIHTTREISRTVSEADVANTVSVKEATLVSAANSAAVATRLVNYYSASQTVEHDVVYARESPGDVVTLKHPFDGGALTGCVESVDMDLDSMLRPTQTVLLGYTPPAVEDIEYFDTSEVISESQTWTVPEGVTSVRAVLIGGGNGGTAGGAGGAGSVTSALVTANDAVGGAGGTGGSAGTGGTGGKVYVVDIDTTGGTAATISVGAAGAANGGTGGNTTFSIGGVTNTSASGSASSGGYTDVITGQTYAAAGAAGTAGKDGGTGGSWRVGYYAENGDNYNATYTGGAGAISGDGYYRDGTSGNQDGWSYAGGGGGGGAANGARGGAGSAGYADQYPPTGSNFSALPGTGGNGANAVAPAAATVYGQGGQGGHGGGGGGGTGCVAWQFSANSYPSGTYSFGTASSGGRGSAGGRGAPGCVILSYRVPRTVASGALMDKNGKLIKGRFDRQLVV